MVIILVCTYVYEYVWPFVTLALRGLCSSVIIRAQIVWDLINNLNKFKCVGTN